MRNFAYFIDAKYQIGHYFPWHIPYDLYHMPSLATKLFDTMLTSLLPACEWDWRFISNYAIRYPHDTEYAWLMITIECKFFS